MWHEHFEILRQEIFLALIALVLLLMKLSSAERKPESWLNLINVLLLVNWMLGFWVPSSGSLFGGGFHTNALIALEKNLLNLATLLVSLLAYDWLRSHRHLPEFYLLLLSTLLGMFFMISSGNLLIFYIGLELSSIPLAALANFDLGRRRSSEAAIKFILSSALASALLLLGISLVYGLTGTLDFQELGSLMPTGRLPLFAFILLLSGFAFKISIVPFHLWTADVFEGSPMAVTAYLAVASKASVLFVLLPVLYRVFGYSGADSTRIILLLALLTMLVGNLFALRQDNLKRLLAFSSITQIGFILVGVLGESRTGTASVVYFIGIYLLSNLGAFSVLSLISARTGKERIQDLKGLRESNPGLAWVLAISLFSLAGVPPTAGFFGKFFLLLAGAGTGHYVLVAFAALNMVISLYYYLRVIGALFMEQAPVPLERMTISFWPRACMLLCSGGVLLGGLIGWIYDYIYSLSPAN
jgi:NADH-quinone oxidoreductase subunit N